MALLSFAFSLNRATLRPTMHSEGDGGPEGDRTNIRREHWAACFWLVIKDQCHPLPCLLHERLWSGDVQLVPNER